LKRIKKVIKLRQGLVIHFPLVLGYASETKILNINITNIYAGIGFMRNLENTDKYTIKFTSSINPLYIKKLNTNFLLTLLFAIDF
jgi:hypothetical protein